ncbi:response regulator [Thalassotalea montiporae]
MQVRDVLIIDDNPDDVEAIQRSLAKCQVHSYQFSSALSGEEGLSLIEVNKYDCILLDYHLPGMSGLDLFRALKAKIPSIPIVVLTGQTDQLTAATLIKQGAQDYINKYNLFSVNLDEKISSAIKHAKTLLPRRTSLDCKVLIIDDNPDDIEMCERLLGKASSDYIFYHAITGQKGMELVKNIQPDCILLDYSLPGVTGIEVLANIVTNHPFIPVIMTTGQGSESVAVNAIKFGAENYLVKAELTASMLDKTIRLAVQKKRHDRQLAIKEQELSEAHNFLELVFQAVPGYMFVKDKDFRLVKVNEQFLQLYGVDDQEQVLGRTTFEDYDPADVEDFLAKDKEAFAAGFSETVEKITFPNGEVRILQTNKVRFTDSAGEPFILGSAADVTERDLLISKLRKSNEDLEQFAYIASHDLKSPLNAIKKLVSWVEEDYGDSMPDGAKQHFNMIKNRAARLSQLLNDLLAYSRLNKKLTDAEHFNFNRLAVSAHELNAEYERFPVVATDIDVMLPRAALQIVLLNLLGNTIKHHHQAQGTITIDVVERENCYEIHYQDDGPGIAPEYADKVFQMFQTLKSKDEVEGSGMGLAMVKKVIDHYQGSVELVYNEQHRQGVHFKIIWPLQQLVVQQTNKEAYDQVR